MGLACLQYFLCVSVSVGFVLDSENGCTSENRPAGSVECVLLKPYYSKKQWATCLTDQYIRTFSKGRYFCRDTSATYCWYQCMLETHGLDKGPVYDDCACGSDAPTGETTRPTAVTPAIPDWCFSPSGTDCSWYKNCLEKRYPCKESGNSYALDFGERFCNLYQQHYSEFYKSGQQWVDGVRRCLQVELVPILRPYVSKTCEEIKQTAFNTHAGCYLDPGRGIRSICHLAPSDWWEIGATVFGSNQNDFEVYKQSFLVGIPCVDNLLIAGTRLMRVGVLARVKITLIPATIAVLVLREMAERFDWNNKGILYFAYPLMKNHNQRKRSIHDITEQNVVNINILLASRSQFDLNAKNMSAANVTVAAIEATEAIAKGDVRLNISDEMQLTSLSICANFNCTETSLKVTPPPLNDNLDVNNTTALSKENESISLTTNAPGEETGIYLTTVPSNEDLDMYLTTVTLGEELGINATTSHFEEHRSKFVTTAYTTDKQDTNASKSSLKEGGGIDVTKFIIIICAGIFQLCVCP